MDFSKDFDTLETTQYIIEELPFYDTFNIQLNKLSELNLKVILEQTGYVLTSLESDGKSVEIKFIKLTGNVIDRVNRIINK